MLKKNLLCENKDIPQNMEQTRYAGQVKVILRRWMVDGSPMKNYSAEESKMEKTELLEIILLTLERMGIFKTLANDNIYKIKSSPGKMSFEFFQM